MTEVLASCKDRWHLCWPWGLLGAGSLFQDQVESPLSKKLKAYLPQITLAQLLLCVRAECEAGCRSQAIQEGGQNREP